VVKDFKTFVAFGDAHGDMCSSSSIDALARHIKDLKPDYVICLGDMFDFRSLRKGIGRDESEAYDDLIHDQTQAYFMLEKLKPDVFLCGNHDWRLYRVAAEHQHGLIRAHAQEGVEKLEKYLKSINCKWYPYHFQKGVHIINKLAFVHGYTANQASVKQHAEMYSPMGGATIMGHLHRIESVNAVRHGGAKGYSGGCLADIDRLSYAWHRPATIRWENGWTYGLIGKKSFKVWQAEKIQNRWILPCSVKEI
jgi:predicted MPP superfamily phosphohydrolase